MPEAQFITVPADRVRHTDDLLINEATKEISENGTPHALGEVHIGDQWCYLKLEDPIGRKKVWKVECDQKVHVVRMVATEAEKRAEANQQIAWESLRDNRRYWLLRQEVASAMMPGIRETRRRSWGGRDESGFQAVGDARWLTRKAEELRNAEAKVELWARVETVAQRDGEDNLSAAETVKADSEERILQGWGGRDQNDDDTREWLRSARQLIAFSVR